MTRDELIAECARRAAAARVEAEDSRRYAAWQRSPEGKARRDEWLGGGPESGDADVATYDDEAAFYEAVQRELEAARDHTCGLPSSIIQALNSGDGSYRP